jgi:hypothetical protein
MNLKEIATVAGKGGLFRVVKPTRTGVILETIDEQKGRTVAGATQRISLLKEISIYTTGSESSIPLEDVMNTIHEKYGKELPVNAKSDPNELADFLGEVVPDYDTERVYPSDMKKLVSWYTILASHAPELFDQTDTEEQKSEEGETPEAEEESAAETTGKADADAPKASKSKKEEKKQ